MHSPSRDTWSFLEVSHKHAPEACVAFDLSCPTRHSYEVSFAYNGDAPRFSPSFSRKRNWRSVELEDAVAAPAGVPNVEASILKC